jgi:hypothetical protein
MNNSKNSNEKHLGKKYTEENKKHGDGTVEKEERGTRKRTCTTVEKKNTEMAH